MGHEDDDDGGKRRHNMQTDEGRWMDGTLRVSTTFSLRPRRVHGNQVHSIIVQCLEVLNPDFQPNLSSSRFYTIANWHLCTLSTKI